MHLTIATLSKVKKYHIEEDQGQEKEKNLQFPYNKLMNKFNKNRKKNKRYIYLLL